MGNYKPLVNALFLEDVANDEYYFGNVMKFDPATGKADIQTWWRDKNGIEPIGGEFETNIEPIRISSFPCCLPNVGVNNQNVFHMPDPDPRTWQIGNFISDNGDGTFTYSVVDVANQGAVINQTSPMIPWENPSGQSFWYPVAYYQFSDEVADWFKNNWGLS